MNQQKIGEFLKYLRKERGLTQEQLAEEFNVSSRTVSRWETGSNMPELDMLIELADFYDVDIREIIDGERKGENMEDETKDTLKKVAEYAVKVRRRHSVFNYAACGALAVALINILFNKESIGILIGIVPESICDLIIKIVAVLAAIGAFILAAYVLGVFDKLIDWIKKRRDKSR